MKHLFSDFQKPFDSSARFLFEQEPTGEKAKEIYTVTEDGIKINPRKFKKNTERTFIRRLNAFDLSFDILPDGSLFLPESKIKEAERKNGLQNFRDEILNILKKPPRKKASAEKIPAEQKLFVSFGRANLKKVLGLLERKGYHLNLPQEAQEDTTKSPVEKFLTAHRLAEGTAAGNDLYGIILDPTKKVATPSLSPDSTIKEVSISRLLKSEILSEEIPES
ncbi:MAG: hypothetical protein K9M51_02705 [Candidatus Gracilibacteria bacterium]|nr:hypothetical protein [Candidatus Gracilibacteria bacterium]